MRTVRGLDAALQAVRAGRRFTADDEAEAAARPWMDRVRREGDEAVLAASERFDGVRPETLRVASASVHSAASELDPELRAAIDLAAERIEAFHRRQPTGGFLDASDGAILGQLIRPIDRVGVYVPGGTAPLFSSLLMCALPARVAGVPYLAAATPPSTDGSVPASVRYAAHIAGIDDLYRIGGVQAIAALAYGTESVAAVDQIVGPGNRFVVAAKRLAFGTVGIEALPGPTETLVLADEEADVEHVAADLLAQAEHLDAVPALVTWSPRLAEALPAALTERLADLPTAAAARDALDHRGLLMIVADATEALLVANAFAPEHLCLLVREPWNLLPQVRNAGGVFVGAYAMEALGDYVAGPSHVMPTLATARFASAVNVRHFQKVIPVVGLTPEAVARIGPAAVRMARAERLEAHARAVLSRLQDGEPA